MSKEPTPQIPPNEQKHVIGRETGDRSEPPQKNPDRPGWQDAGRASARGQMTTSPIRATGGQVIGIIKIKAQGSIFSQMPKDRGV